MVKTVTITGASGFIGGHLCRYLSEVSPGFIVNTLSVRGDLEALRSGPTGDILVHCAGIAHSTSNEKREITRINEELPFETARWARQAGYGQFLFFSSALVWGDHQQTVDVGKDVPEPSSVYGKAKLAAELRLRELSTEGFVVSIVRLPLVYGPGVKGNLARLIDLITRWPLIPVGSRTAMRSLCGVDTIGRFVSHLIDNRLGGVFTLVDAPVVSTYDMGRYIALGLHRTRHVVSSPAIMEAAIKRLNPAIGTRLYGNKVFRNGGIEDVGFSPRKPEEQIREDFAIMARYHVDNRS